VIVLDTNVLSELMRANPDRIVRAWVAAQPRETLYTTSVTKAQILYGIAALPEGRRRSGLTEAAEGLFGEDFESRVLPFDEDAAVHYAQIVADRRRAAVRWKPSTPRSPPPRLSPAPRSPPATSTTSSIAASC
jgi:predicted nucleic acid-binding protein